VKIWELFGSIELQGDSDVLSGIDKISNGFKSAGSAMVGFGSKLTAGVTVPILAVAAKFVKLASDLEEVKNVVNVTFGQNANAVIDWSSTLKEKFGMVQLESLKYVGSMGAMLKSSGFSTEASEKMAKSMVELTGDMSSFYNLSHEEVWEKIRAGIAGETEPLKVLGINMSVANMEAFALAEGIKKPWKEMSQSEQTQLRYQYLMQQTALAQGDFARTSDGLANRIRIFQGTIDELGAKLGTVLLPGINDILGKLVEWMEKLANMDPENQKLLIFVGGLAAVIPPLIVILGLFVGAIGSLLTPVGLVIGAIGLLTGAFVANYIQEESLQGAFTMLIFKLGELKNFVMNTVVPALQYLATGEGLEKVQNASIITKDNVEDLRKKFIDFKDECQRVWDKIEDLRKKFIDFKDECQRVWDKIVELKDLFVLEFSPVLKDLKKLWAELKELGGNFKDVLNQIKNSAGDSKKEIKGAADAASELVKAFTQIISWGNTVISTIVSIDKWFKNLNKSLDQVLNKIPGISSINKAVNSILPGYATGTVSSPQGWAMVGEHGPELAYLQKGTQIINSNETRSILNNNSSQSVSNFINISIPMNNLKDLMTWDDFINRIGIEGVTRGGVF
jgi:hypothetical protein